MQNYKNREDKKLEVKILKVAFSVGTLNSTSGVVKVVVNIINELSKTGRYEIAIICNRCDSTDLRLMDEIEIINVNVPIRHKAEWALLIKPLKQLFEKRKFDVLVVSEMAFVPFYYIAAHRSGVHMYAWEHRNFGAGPKLRLEWFGKRLAVRRLDGTISITKRDNGYYREYCERRHIDGKLFQIYNLTDFDRGENCYDADSRKIISVGYLAPIKGFDILMDVAEALLKKETNWSWDIYGKGTEKGHLESLIKRRHLENHVFLKGYCSNIYERYSQYSMFVLTSRKEGMGMVLIEAQKSKLPVVSFDIDCGPSDVISDGVNGYLIPPFDAERMAERIATLLQSKKLRKAFSDCSERNLEEFEKKIIVKKWESLLNNGDM